MHVSVLVATIPVGNACLGPHAPRDGFVDNNPENYTGSLSFYFSRFPLLGVSGYGLEWEKQEALPFFAIMGDARGRLRLADGKL